jgi:RNA methyltransferase, TrmH family
MRPHLLGSGVARNTGNDDARRGRNPFAESTAPITSRENHWLKEFRAALQATGAPRGGSIGAEGPRLVEEALLSECAIEAILVSPAGERHLGRLHGALDRAALATGRWPQILHTTDRLLAGVAGTETPQGIAALLRPRVSSFDDLLRGGAPLVIMLIGVQDPGNVGTVIRSAEAFGATGVIAARGTAHPLAPKALRAAAGSALRLPLLCGLNPAIALAQLRVAGVNLCAASSSAASGAVRGKAAVPFSHVDFRAPVALLIGSEGAGLPSEVEDAADVLVRIALAAPVESLNAGVAASILMYEAARQRGLLN